MAGMSEKYKKGCITLLTSSCPIQIKVPYTPLAPAPLQALNAD
jgi:hypothetical protein